MESNPKSKIKSPFYIIPEFISPKKCDEILTQVELSTPDRDAEGKPVAHERFHEVAEAQLFQRLKEHIPALEKHFNCRYVGTEKMKFQMLPENPKDIAIAAGCANSKYLRKKWTKVMDVDLTCILWLKDYHDSVPIDPSTEIYGGKLEFPLYNFSFVPQRGTLVVYPAGPHFISVTSPVMVGDLYQVRFNLSIKKEDGSMWLYQPSEYPYDKQRGIIDSWLNDHV